MRVTFTKVSKTKLEVKVEDANGQPLFNYSFVALSERAQLTLADRLGKKLSEITPWIAAAMRDGGSEGDASVTQEKFTILLRGLYERGEQGLEFTGGNIAELLRSVLDYKDYPADNPVLKWQGTELLAVLDIDYHKLEFDSRPDPDTLRAIVSEIRPTPIISHPSHKRGMKLFYVAQDGYTAEELAASAALSWIGKDARATAEVLCMTRHPGYIRIDDDASYAPVEYVWHGNVSPDLEAVAHWFGKTVSQEAIENYLQENGLELHRKYSHDKCPINPLVGSSRDPVYVGDYGMVCNKCRGEGLSYGNRRTPGFVPFTALVGGSQSEIADMARNAVHWTHAEYVLKNLFYTPVAILKLAYKCALKMTLGTRDPRVNGVFRTEKIARINGSWIFVGDKNGTEVNPSAKRIFEQLPVTWDVSYTADGVPKLKINGAKVDAISHSGRSLIDYGYLDIKTVHGMQMWGRNNPYVDGTIPLADTFSHMKPENHPKYIPAKYRSPELVEAAWRALEDVFPQIDRNYVRLLVAARGIVEAGISNVFILTYGPSKTGKSSTVGIVAGLLGDKWTEPRYNGDEERLRQGIANSIAVGSYTIIDELFKTSQAKKIDPRTAVDPILTLTKNSTSHKLYVGPTKLGGCTVCTFTDIELPYEVRADVQLSRRIISVRLKAKVDWMTSMAKHGINGLNEFRQVSQEHNLFADILCSAWVDEFFDRPRTIEELVSMTPYKFLEYVEDFGDPKVILKLFFEQVCEAPTLDGADLKRYNEPGWKRISMADMGELRDLWDQLADGTSGERWKHSRRVKEEDWSMMLRNWYGKNVAHGVDCEFRYYKDSVIYVRFRLVEGEVTKYNEEILG